MFTDLVCCVPLGLTDNTRPHSKDIVSKPQFVIDFERDIYLLLYSHIINKGLKTKVEYQLRATYEELCSALRLYTILNSF